MLVISVLMAFALGQAAPTATSPETLAQPSPPPAASSAAPAKASKAKREAASKGFITPNTTDQIFASGPLDKAGATIMRGDSMATMSMNRLADQRALAKKAATMINAGHCPEALQLVVGKGDGLLAGNIAKACGLPEPTIR